MSTFYEEIIKCSLNYHKISSNVHFISFYAHGGAQFEGNFGEILALGAEISPYIGLREYNVLGVSLKKKQKKNFFFLSFHLVSTP